jgi:nucleoside-diphosphate-sugar epimerase
MKRIAILGANGFLGSPMTDAFSEGGWEVVAFSRQKNPDNDRQEIVADIFDEENLRSALRQAKPEVVISTAWDTEHGKFWTSDLNVKYRDATLTFAEMCFESGVEAFAGIGTVSEYGIKAGICNAETSPLVPNDIYATSKIETGLNLKVLGEKFGARTHWLRIFQAFGPNEKPDRFIPGLISSLRRGEKFSIRTPNFDLDWIHTADIASATKFIIENELRHFVDVGTGVATSVRDLSEMICDELMLDATLLDYSDQVPGHEKTVVVDPASLLFSAGWSPTGSLESRIRSLR